MTSPVPQTPEPTDEQRAVAEEIFYDWWSNEDPSAVRKHLPDAIARALAAAVQQERDKVETVLLNAEKTLSDDDPMAYGQGWYDGQTTIISRIREVSR